MINSAQLCSIWRVGPCQIIMEWAHDATSDHFGSNLCRLQRGLDIDLFCYIFTLRFLRASGCSASVRQHQAICAYGHALPRACTFIEGVIFHVSLTICRGWRRAITQAAIVIKRAVRDTPDSITAPLFRFHGINRTVTFHTAAYSQPTFAPAERTRQQLYADGYASCRSPRAHA